MKIQFWKFKPSLLVSISETSEFDDIHQPNRCIYYLLNKTVSSTRPTLNTNNFFFLFDQFFPVDISNLFFSISPCSLRRFLQYSPSIGDWIRGCVLNIFIAPQYASSFRDLHMRVNVECAHRVWNSSVIQMPDISQREITQGTYAGLFAVMSDRSRLLATVNLTNRRAGKIVGRFCAILIVAGVAFAFPWKKIRFICCFRRRFMNSIFSSNIQNVKFKLDDARSSWKLPRADFARGLIFHGRFYTRKKSKNDNISRGRRSRNKDRIFGRNYDYRTRIPCLNRQRD